MKRVDRRELLKGVGAAGLVATAGCLDVLNGDDNGDDTGLEPENGDDNGDESFGQHKGVPEYASYVPADGMDVNDGVQLGYTDIERLEELEQEGESMDDAYSERDMEEDSLLALPFSGAMASMMGAEFGLIPYEFAESALNGDDSSMQTDGVLFIDGSIIVLFGSYDKEAVIESTPRFEPFTEMEEFDIYEAEGDDDDEEINDLAYAVSEDAIIASIGSEGNPTNDVGLVVATATGEEENVAEAHDGMDWALGTAGHGEMVLGGWHLDEIDDAVEEPGEEDGDTDPASELFDDAELIVAGMSVETASSTSRLSAEFEDDIDDDKQTNIEGLVGQTAEDRQMAFDGRRTHVVGTWEV